MTQDLIIINADGSVTTVAEGVDINEYVGEYGGIIILRQDYVEPPYVPSHEEIVVAENEWRDQQMPIARNNVTAIQFGDEDVPGTEQQWKDYWLALRKWTTDNPDFPDMNKRPIQPS